MQQLRKTYTRKPNSDYYQKPIIRVTKHTQAAFIASKLIIDRLNLDTSKDAVMFGFKSGKLYIFKEPKEDDNYHLSTGDKNTYRFKSVELYDLLINFYKIEKYKDFVLEMQNDLSFVLLSK
jgi:hypothetical protein